MNEVRAVEAQAWQEYKDRYHLDEALRGQLRAAWRQIADQEEAIMQVWLHDVPEDQLAKEQTRA
jgi:type II secretory pathway component PulM